MQLFDTDALDQAILVQAVIAPSAGAGTNAGPLNGAKVHLTKALVVTGRDAVLADLAAAEANYTGYAAAAVTWAAAADESSDNSDEIIGTVPEFKPTDAVSPNTVFNLYITNAAGTVLYLSGAFDETVNMQDALHQLTVTLRFRLGDETLVDVIA